MWEEYASQRSFWTLTMTTVIGVILSVPTLTRNLFEWPAHNLQKSQPTGLSSFLVCIHSQNAVTYSSVSHTYYQSLMILSVWAGWWWCFLLCTVTSKLLHCPWILSYPQPHYRILPLLLYFSWDVWLHLIISLKTQLLW